MSHSLNSLGGFYRGLYRGLLQGLLRGILGIKTMAHLSFGVWGVVCKKLGEISRSRASGL